MQCSILEYQGGVHREVGCKQSPRRRGRSSGRSGGAGLRPAEHSIEFIDQKQQKDWVCMESIRQQVMLSSQEG